MKLENFTQNPLLETTVAGIDLRNPFILASGILGETRASLERVARSGVGAVTTKSVGIHPQEGHQNPTIVELPYGLINAMGLPNPGIDSFCQEMKEIDALGVPVIGSIFADRAIGFSELARRMEQLGVRAIELNLSCPHVKGYGASIGSDPTIIYSITSAVRKVCHIPLLVKLTPNLTDIGLAAKAAVDGGCNGIVAINTLKAIAINAQLAKPILSSTYGGYSGPGIKPVGLRCVYEIASLGLHVPIIGVGGIQSGIDAVEYLMAGASAVAIGTTFSKFRMETIHKLARELVEFMKENNYQHVRQMVGKALNPGQATSQPV